MPHNEYPTNGNEQIHYAPDGKDGVDMNKPSYDGTEQTVEHNQGKELYNDTNDVNPDGGETEYPDSNQEYEQYNDTTLANPEAYDFSNDSEVEHEDNGNTIDSAESDDEQEESTIDSAED